MTGAKHASVIVMDPKTGEILAMANRPSDPNNYNQSGEEAFKNIAVTNLYRPGSQEPLDWEPRRLNTATDASNT